MQTLERIIGAQAAGRLVERLGGSEWYIPGKWADDHAIVHAIGRDKAERLSGYMAGLSLNVPVCAVQKRAARNAEIHRRFVNGESSREIALTLGLSQRMVRYILRQPPPDHAARTT